MVASTVTFWRIFLAGAVTLIGLFLLFHGIRAIKAHRATKAS
jgi:hypothetical protein